MLTGTRERCLISFIVLMVFGVVQLHLILSHPRGLAPNHTLPCPLHPGIHWVRDPHACSRYFICVAFQPIRMPACPEHTVWSVNARNCVPVNSQWDDCDYTPHQPRPSSYPSSATPTLLADHASRQPRPSSYPSSATPTPLGDHASRQPRPSSYPSSATPTPLGDHASRQPRPSSYPSSATPTPLGDHASRQPRPSSYPSSATPTPLGNHASRQPRPSTATPLLDNSPVHHRLLGTTRLWHHALHQSRPTPNVTDADEGDRTEASDGTLSPSEYLHPGNPQRDQLKRVLPNHPCVLKAEASYLPHPRRCHWFYNCSHELEDELTAAADHEGWDGLTEECPYPQLFSLDTRTCQHYSLVHCRTRGLFLDPCDYRQLNCHSAHCQPCSLRHGSCVGMRDGLQPYPSREWTPRYLVCKDQRALQQADCPQDKPIFSPETLRCESLMDIPKAHGGYQISCRGRHDGRYPDETGRCNVFYQCVDGVVQGRFECPPGTVFHPERQTCRRKNARGVPPPCGSNSTGRRHVMSVTLCGGLEDGLYADPYGRCSLYYQCQRHVLQEYHRCDFGSFDPRYQVCQFSGSGLPAPCGDRPNPCLHLPDGLYPDLTSHCQAAFQCKRNLFVRQHACPLGTVFHREKGACLLPDDTPPPCGLAPSCTGKADGRYASPLKGCHFYFTCRGGVFGDYRRCSVEEGGFYFNTRTGSCDFPQNVCAPCGLLTENCTVS